MVKIVVKRATKSKIAQKCFFTIG